MDDNDDKEKFNIWHLFRPVIPHYYGTFIRELFFGVGFFMLLGIPFFYSAINFSSYILLFVILGLNLLAGFTNPQLRVSIIFDFLVSLVGVIFFELIVFSELQTSDTLLNGYLWFNQILALIFFVSLYFSTKTLRALFIGE